MSGLMPSVAPDRLPTVVISDVVWFGISTETMPSNFVIGSSVWAPFFNRSLSLIQRGSWNSLRYGPRRREGEEGLDVILGIRLPGVHISADYTSKLTRFFAQHRSRAVRQVEGRRGVDFFLPEDLLGHLNYGKRMEVDHPVEPEPSMGPDYWLLTVHVIPSAEVQLEDRFLIVRCVVPKSEPAPVHYVTKHCGCFPLLPPVGLLGGRNTVVVTVSGHEVYRMSVVLDVATPPQWLSTKLVFSPRVVDQHDGLPLLKAFEQMANCRLAWVEGDYIMRRAHLHPAAGSVPLDFVLLKYPLKMAPLWAKLAYQNASTPTERQARITELRRMENAVVHYHGTVTFAAEDFEAFVRFGEAGAHLDPLRGNLSCSRFKSGRSLVWPGRMVHATDRCRLSGTVIPLLLPNGRIPEEQRMSVVLDPFVRQFFSSSSFATKTYVVDPKANLPRPKMGDRSREFFVCYVTPPSHQQLADDFAAISAGKRCQSSQIQASSVAYLVKYETMAEGHLPCRILVAVTEIEVRLGTFTNWFARHRGWFPRIMPRLGLAAAPTLHPVSALVHQGDFSTFWKSHLSQLDRGIGLVGFFAYAARHKAVTTEEFAELALRWLATGLDLPHLLFFTPTAAAPATGPALNPVDHVGLFLEELSDSILRGFRQVAKMAGEGRVSVLDGDGILSLEWVGVGVEPAPVLTVSLLMGAVPFENAALRPLYLELGLEVGEVLVDWSSWPGGSGPRPQTQGAFDFADLDFEEVLGFVDQLVVNESGELFDVGLAPMEPSPAGVIFRRLEALEGEVTLDIRRVLTHLLSVPLGSILPPFASDWSELGQGLALVGGSEVRLLAPVQERSGGGLLEILLFLSLAKEKKVGPISLFHLNGRFPGELARLRESGRGLPADEWPFAWLDSASLVGSTLLELVWKVKPLFLLEVESSRVCLVDPLEGFGLLDEPDSRPVIAVTHASGQVSLCCQKVCVWESGDPASFPLAKAFSCELFYVSSLELHQPILAEQVDWGILCAAESEHPLMKLIESYMTALEYKEIVFLGPVEVSDGNFDVSCARVPLRLDKNRYAVCLEIEVIVDAFGPRKTLELDQTLNHDIPLEFWRCDGRLVRLGEFNAKKFTVRLAYVFEVKEFG